MRLATVRVKKVVSMRLLLSQHTDLLTMRLHTLTPHASHRSLEFGVLPQEPLPDAFREVLEGAKLVGQLLPVVYLTPLGLSVSLGQLYNSLELL
eukprot:294510-Rhodomonas_salina.2